ncbi:7879_t:CDS:2 [Paraglomus occultum]|uniref:7879_t:CDS:1 n=1 Tax=Paraglomus occultum TaxID=144539 RepID=A0A9N8ZJH8_9GLOM|nr:7879_t:CDS:2 [Paraglomus occultum]
MTSRHDIPIIDFSLFETKKVTCAQQIKEASVSIGFLYLRNHGIDQSDIDNIFVVSQEYFSLPTETKLEHRIKRDNFGYSALHQETLDPETQNTGDFKEAFNFGKFVGGNCSQELPATLAQHKDFLAKFSRICHNLCLKILEAFAIALEIPETEGGKGWFTERHLYELESGDILRVLHYPAVKSIDHDDMRAGSHSDYGSLTLLFQKDVGGLEVLSGDDQWISAPVIPGCVLVNIGDLLEYWSGGLFRSTKHRVVFRHDNLLLDRYSVAYFCHAADDVSLEPIPSRLVVGRMEVNSSDGRVLTAGQHLRNRLDASYKY